MTRANNFAQLNLTKLEKCILEKVYTLNFSCLGYNVRTLRLESDGNLILSVQGFTFIPCLEKLESTIDNPNENIGLDNKTCFVPGIVDTDLDSRIFARAILTFQKSSSNRFLAILEDGDKNLLLREEDTKLALLLDKINRFLHLL